jgi:hypothetical protein
MWNKQTAKDGPQALQERSERLCRQEHELASRQAQTERDAAALRDQVILEGRAEVERLHAAERESLETEAKRLKQLASELAARGSALEEAKRDFEQEKRDLVEGLRSI